MKYIYIDESGFLGNSSFNSFYFVVSAVLIDDFNNKKWVRIPKKVRQKTLKKRTKKISELKFSSTSKNVKMKFFDGISKLDFNIYAVVIDKRLIKDDLKNQLPTLYNYLLKVLLEKPVGDLSKKDKITICIDKSMSSKQKDNFESYIKTNLLEKHFNLNNIVIVHEMSHTNQGLVVNDFVCGAFGYKYNSGKSDCDKYVNLIKDKIVIEKNDLFKKK